MNEEGLSPAARREFEKIKPRLEDGDPWNFESSEILRTIASKSFLDAPITNDHEKFGAEIEQYEHLASREIPDASVIEVRNQGFAAWEKSREELKVAFELQQFARNELLSIFGDYGTTSRPLDDFLVELIPIPTKGNTREQEFMEFLRTLIERKMMPLVETSSGVERRESEITSEAELSWSYLASEGISTSFETDIRDQFLQWRGSQKHETNLTVTNAARTGKKAEKMEKMLGLLPHSPRANQTIGLVEWRKKAKQLLSIPSSTFDKYRKELKPRFVEKPKWRFRVDTAKPSEKM